METARSMWVVSAVIDATADEAQAAAEATGLALCPDPEHEGYCRVPRTTMVTRFEDLEPDEEASWQAVSTSSAWRREALESQARK